jgi:UDP-glucose 4-epimerase
MTSLITGGAGFIGSHLAERLLSQGETVRIVDDFSTGRWENIEHLLGSPGLEVVTGSILDRQTLDPLIRDADVVYHLAAAVGAKLILARTLESLRTNVQGTEMVFDLARRYGRKVVLASTSEVYGKGYSQPLRESDDLVLGSTAIARWSYASSKLLDEHLALAHSRELRLPVVIVRFFNIVGRRQTGRYGMVLPTFVRQALAGDTITVYGDGEQIRTFTGVGDAVEAVLRLAMEPKAEGHVFNVGSRNSIAINSLAEMIKRETGSGSTVSHTPYNEAYGEGFEDIRHRVPDISKLKQYTGYEPDTSLEKVVCDVISHSRGTHFGSDSEADTRGNISALFHI